MIKYCMIDLHEIPGIVKLMQKESRMWLPQVEVRRGWEVTVLQYRVPVLQVKTIMELDGSAGRKTTYM